MDAGTIDPTGPDCNEDYTGAVCLLVKGGYTLADVEEFDGLLEWPWYILKGRVLMSSSVYVAKRGAVGSFCSLSRALMKATYRQQVDHINRNPLDNRKSNLRLCKAWQNSLNKEPRAGCSSKYKGVTKLKGKEKWVANARVRGMSTYLGTFDDEDQAALAYNRFVRKKAGAFAYLNPIEARPRRRFKARPIRRRKKPKKPPISP